MHKFGLLLALGSIIGMAACGGGGGGSSSSSGITSVSVSCSPGTVGSDGSSQCSATVNGTGNFSTGVTWSASAGSISQSGLLTAPSVSGSSSSGSGGTSNVAPIVVDAGPEPQTFTSVNQAFTTVTVCVPGSTSQCQTIDHVWVDTGSSGLRLISGVLNSTSVTVTATSTQDTSVSGSATVTVTLLPLTAYNECLVFLDGYVWGPVATADISFPGATAETASSVPVQMIIPSSSSPTVPSSCSNQNPSGGSGNEGGSSNSNSVSTFGANGIIGVGLFSPDCGGYCVSQGSSCNGSSNAPCLYYQCPSSGCTPANIPLAQQVPNPVALFATDNNGVLIQLPSVGNGGAPTASGSLIFGIGTQSNNGLGSAQVYDVPDSGNNAGNFTTNFNGNVYTGSFVDSGSNGFFFNDSSIQQCGSQNAGWYCPTTSPLSLSASNQGTNMSSPVTVNFSIENADNLFSSGNAAFSTLAGPYSSTPAEFDWGLSFFYGRNMFTAIDGASTPGGTGPYFAF